MRATTNCVDTRAPALPPRARQFRLSSNLRGDGLHDHEDSDDELAIFERDAAAAAADFDDRGNEIDDDTGQGSTMTTMTGTTTTTNKASVV